ncbi:MAG: FAD-dependent oxidoreductase [Limisphaerales bacterium]
MKGKNLSCLLFLITALMGDPGVAAPSPQVFLEAEQFADLGGWDLDQQSMEVMGSPYLLAHGLGVPVRDAVTTATFPLPGMYHVWVRTRDWVGPWHAPGTPGRFQLLMDGRPLTETFGTKGADWHWQDGGTVKVSTQAKVALHDLTGFEGRCDAVFFCQDAGFTPPDEASALARFRRAALGLPEEPEDGGEFDLVVVGGGVAGTSAALSAARQGLRVALVQDRPVLGGNGSSEVRVWPEGNTGQTPYPHIGDIVNELVPAKGPGTGNARNAAIYEDQRKFDVVRAEPRITLLTEQRVFAVVARDGRIRSVDAQHIRTARRTRLRAKLFADCTGDATVGFLAGADYQYSREEHQGASNLWNLMDASDPAEVLKCECKDKDSLAISVKEGNVAMPFPRCPWAVDLTDKPFPGRKNFKGQWVAAPLSNLGAWFWEGGFDQDMVTDIERIRDQNFRAMYGAWDALKNVDHLYPNHRLGWAAFIAGKRESRRLLGDVVLTGDDFRREREFPDGCFPCSWHIDIHTPHPNYDQGFKGEEFISQATTGAGFDYKGPYWAPYRSLYSRNVTNLFMAGRDISVTREGLGPVRVMKTCGMMGEIVGKAAWICVRFGTPPRGVYEDHLSLLKELMLQPGAMRRDRLDGTLSAPPSAKPTAGIPRPATPLGFNPAQ